MAEIKKVVIEAGGKEFSLSVEEAKALRDILNSTFPESKTTYVPFYQPPIIIERDRRYPYHGWDTWRSGDVVYCSTGTLTTGNATCDTKTVTLDDMAKMSYTKEP